MKQTIRLLNLFTLSLLFLSNTTAQNCTDFNLIYKEANQAETDETYCSYINQLESILNDCLTQKDSLDESLGNLYHDIGAICYNCFIYETSLLHKAVKYYEHAVKIKSSYPRVFSRGGGLCRPLKISSSMN